MILVHEAFRVSIRLERGIRDHIVYLSSNRTTVVLAHPFESPSLHILNYKDFMTFWCLSKGAGETLVVELEFAKLKRYKERRDSETSGSP